MTPTWRKPAGALGIVAWIVVWVVVIASFSAPIGRLPTLAQMAIYLFTGIVWIVPLRPVLLWMETGLWRLPR